MASNAGAGENTDCDLVGMLWDLLSRPGSEYYLGSIIRNGLRVPSLGIDIAPFPRIDVGDIPEQTMFEWALEYMGISMSRTVLGGIDSYQSGTMQCTPVSRDQTDVRLGLTFGLVDFTGAYDVGLSGVSGCAIKTAETILGGGLATSGPGEDERLALASWYGDVALDQTNNGQLLDGAYWLHQDTLQEITMADTNPARQYRESLARQRESADAVTAATKWYRDERDGKNPPGPPPEIGDDEQYAGGFATYIDLLWAVDHARRAAGAPLEPGNDHAELMNAMTQFNGQVLKFQDDHPREVPAGTVMRAVADGEPLSQAELERLGVKGIPQFGDDSNAITHHVPTWPVDRERARRAHLARADARVEAPDAWFHVRGTFKDEAQVLTLTAAAAFTARGEGLYANVTEVDVRMANLHITLGNKDGWNSQPGLYERVASWIANTQAFQDLLKSKLEAALDSPQNRQKLTDALNAGLRKLGLQPV